MHLSHLPDKYTSFLISKFRPGLKISSGKVENLIHNLVAKGDKNLAKFARAVLDDNVYGKDGLVDNYLTKGEYRSIVPNVKMSFQQRQMGDDV